MTIVDLGWGRDPIPKQLEGSVIPVAKLQWADDCASAIIRLHAGGLITHTIADRARKMLLKRLGQEARDALKAAKAGSK